MIENQIKRDLQMNSRSLVGFFFLDMSILKLALNTNQSINGYVKVKLWSIDCCF